MRSLPGDQSDKSENLSEWAEDAAPGDYPNHEDARQVLRCELCSHVERWFLPSHRLNQLPECPKIYFPQEEWFPRRVAKGSFAGPRGTQSTAAQTCKY